MKRTFTQALYREHITALAQRLRAEAKPGRSLADAQEIRIGIHADIGSWKASGLYIVPMRDRVTDEETNSWQHVLRMRIIAQTRVGYWKGDTGDKDDDLSTFILTDLVGGVVDVVKEDRDLTPTSYLSFGGSENADEITFEVAAQSEAGPFYYRAEIPVDIEIEGTA